jgi:hypothetical protein
MKFVEKLDTSIHESIGIKSVTLSLLCKSEETLELEVFPGECDEDITNMIGIVGPLIQVLIVVQSDTWDSAINIATLVMV